MRIDNVKNSIDPVLYQTIKMLAVKKGVTIPKMLDEVIEFYLLFATDPIEGGEKE